MVRRGEPLSRIGRGQPLLWVRGGLLIAKSRVPRACRAATGPVNGIGLLVVLVSLDAGDCPAEPGEFARRGDGDDRAAFRARLEPLPCSV